MTQYPFGGVLLIGLCLSAAACGGKDEKGTGGPVPIAKAPEEKDFGKGDKQVDPTPSANPPPAMTAEQVFSTRCATCHGPKGAGDGPAAAALNPKPRNYADAAWQKSVTDEHIKKTIIEGGAAVGKSALMVPNPDLANQPVVVDGLVKIVRSFGPQGG